MLDPAKDLADAIREHRDAKWQGGKVTDPLDLKLYGALVWAETATEDLDSPILDV